MCIRDRFKSCLDAISKLGKAKPKNLAFPEEIGCGYGGGNWPKYHAMIKEFAEANPDVEVTIVSWGKNTPEEEDPEKSYVERLHEKFLETFTKDCQQGNVPGAVTEEAIDELASLMEERQRSHGGCSGKPRPLPVSVSPFDSVKELSELPFYGGKHLSLIHI